MKRWRAALQWDMRIQFRHGFYYVSVMVIAVMAGLARMMPVPAAGIGLLVPAFIVFALTVTTFFFMAALVLLEKSEGVLTGLVVTPLRDLEYLSAKVVSLTLLGMVETFVIIVVVSGFSFQPGPLVTGLILLGAFYALAGFITIARYDSINEFLLPATAVIFLLSLPLLAHFHIWTSPLFYLHPLHPFLILLRGGYETLAPADAVYAFGAGGLWVMAALLWARRIFHHFVIRQAGS